MGVASVEETLALWVASLGEIKKRIRPLFTQERVARNAGLFLESLLGDEQRKTGRMRAEAAGDPGPWREQAILGRRDWDADALRDIVRDYVIEHLADDDAVLVIDETGFLKQGKATCGVARQYCGQLGKQDNCQAAVSLSITNRDASLPVGYRLYLPQEWAADAARRRKAHVPEEIVFKTKPEIALDQLRWACEAGLPRGVVLLDAGYGNHTSLRTEIGALGLSYAAGILSNTSVWAPGTEPLPPRRWSGRGRRPTRLRRSAKNRPVSVKDVAFRLLTRAWRTIGWREGSAEWLTSRFARVRVRAAHRDERHDEEWLLIEWPKGEKEPTKYWLSTLPADISFERLVDLAKLRRRIERDYQELKQELRLGHFEGRGWRGFHHHATLCIAAYGFLISERETIPPSRPRPPAWLAQFELPADYRPRGAANPNSAAHSKLDCNHATTPDLRSRQKRSTMSLLRAKKSEKQPTTLVTQ